MEQKRWLQIFRDGHADNRYLTEPLAEGEQGNWQTLEAMGEIVRHDRTQPDLRKFVLREIVRGVRGHDADGELDACFRYAQSGIVYRRDPWGIERVADMWSTLYALNPDDDAEPEGDCGIKSTFFATCAALLGYRPAFVIAKERPEMSAYSHIYAAVAVNGQWRYYDPTPEDAPPGWQLDAYDRRIFDIFDAPKPGIL